MISPDEVRWCTPCLAREIKFNAVARAGAKQRAMELEVPAVARVPLRVPAVAVEHGREFGSRFMCEGCARRAAALGAKLESIQDFWQRLAAEDAAYRLGGT